VLILLPNSFRAWCPLNAFCNVMVACVFSDLSIKLFIASFRAWCPLTAPCNTFAAFLSRVFNIIPDTFLFIILVLIAFLRVFTALSSNLIIYGIIF